MEKYKIAVGSDHAGFDLKNLVIEHLKKRNIEINDFGTYDKKSCDYPVIAKKIAEEVANKNYEYGILICGTGIGVCIAANKVKGIRAALCTDTFSAHSAMEHNNANILCLGGRITGPELALDIVDAWLNATFQGGRHQRRVEMIE